MMGRMMRRRLNEISKQRRGRCSPVCPSTMVNHRKIGGDGGSWASFCGTTSTTAAARNIIFTTGRCRYAQHFVENRRRWRLNEAAAGVDYRAWRRRARRRRRAAGGRPETQLIVPKWNTNCHLGEAPAATAVGRWPGQPITGDLSSSVSPSLSPCCCLLREHNALSIRQATETNSNFCTNCVWKLPPCSSISPRSQCMQEKNVIPICREVITCLFATYRLILCWIYGTVFNNNIFQKLFLWVLYSCACVLRQMCRFKVFFHKGT